MKHLKTYEGLFGKSNIDKSKIKTYEGISETPYEVKKTTEERLRYLEEYIVDLEKRVDFIERWYN